MKRILGASPSDQERLSLFGDLCDELMAHAAAEEQTLYAELLTHSQQQIQQSVVDNDQVVELISQLQDLDVTTAEWMTKFESLREKVEQHLEREEALLLPLARTRIKRRRAKALGERFEQLKLRELSIWGKQARHLGEQARKRRAVPRRRRSASARLFGRQPTSVK